VFIARTTKLADIIDCDLDFAQLYLSGKNAQPLALAATDLLRSAKIKDSSSADRGKQPEHLPRIPRRARRPRKALTASRRPARQAPPQTRLPALGRAAGPTSFKLAYKPSALAPAQPKTQTPRQCQNPIKPPAAGRSMPQASPAAHSAPGLPP